MRRKSNHDATVIFPQTPCDNSSRGSNQSDILSDDDIVPAFAIFLFDGSSDIPCSQSVCESQFDDVRSSLSQHSQQKPWKSPFSSQHTWLSLLTQFWADLATIYLVLIQPSYSYWPNLTTNQSPLLSLWYRPIHAESCNNKFIQSRIIAFLFSIFVQILAYSKAVSINGAKDQKFDFNSNPV